MGRLLAASVVGPSGRGSAPPSWANNLDSTTKIQHSIFFYPSVSTFTSAAYRLKQREKEGLSLAIKGIVISLMYGNTIMALTLGLVTFLYTGYREGTIEATQDAQRNAREELAAIKEQYYYNNPFSQQKEEEQQVRRGGGFRR